MDMIDRDSKRYSEISTAVDLYNRQNGDGNPPPLSPFIARFWGHLGDVADEIGVPVNELGDFLVIVDRDLPQDYLIGG